MPTTKNEASAEQQSNYLESLLKAKAAVEEALGLLRSIKSITGDPQETNTINVQLLDLEGDSAKLQAKILAFVSSNASFEPPTQEIIESIQSTAEELDKFIAEAGKAIQVITLATSVINDARRMFA